MIEWNTAGLLALGGIAIASWRQIKAIGTQLASYVVSINQVDYWVSRAVYVYCAEKLKPLPFRPKSFLGIYLFRRSTQLKQLTVYEQMMTNVMIFRNGLSFMVICQSRTNGNNESSGQSLGTAGCKIYSLRAFCNVDKFIKTAVDYFNKRVGEDSNNELNPNAQKRFYIHKEFGRGGLRARLSHNNDSLPQVGVLASSGPGPTNFELDRRFGCYRAVSCDPSDIQSDEVESKNVLEVYSFPSSILHLIEETRRWYKAELFYKEKGIPWTRGWLLYGPSGTGKTSLLRAIGQEIDLPIIIMDLATMSNEELSRSWSSLSSRTPCMVVLEDIDSVFHGRKNILGETSGGLTFDCLLNCISGISRVNGVFLGITTNDLSKIDPAIGQESSNGSIATRPGRVDRIIHVSYMDEDCRRRHATRLFDQNPEDVEKFVQAGDGMTAAQFNDLCVKRCLELFWDKTAKSETEQDDFKVSLKNL
jgi:hypothetical protein